ncbi:MAG: hypothetical protein HEEMFOPI_01308 [Holosporales bacterium]
MYFLLFIFFICTVIFSQTREITQNGNLIGTENILIAKDYEQDKSALVKITNNTNAILELDVTILYSNIYQINNITFLRCLQPQSTISITLRDFAHQLGEQDRFFSPRRWNILEHAINGVCIDERYKDRLITWIEEGDKHAHYIFMKANYTHFPPY